MLQNEFMNIYIQWILAENRLMCVFVCDCIVECSFEYQYAFWLTWLNVWRSHLCRKHFFVILLSMCVVSSRRLNTAHIHKPFRTWLIEETPTDYSCCKYNEKFTKTIKCANLTQILFQPRIVIANKMSALNDSKNI